MSGIDLQGETEQSLVQAMREGKQNTLGILYDAYAPIMLGVISRIVPDTELAEEVLKETFVAIWERIGIYDASRERLLTWGLAIARGIALEAIKSDRYSNEIDPQKILSNGTSINKGIILQNGQLKKIDLCNLNLQEKLVLELLYLKGRSCTEAASELNLTREELVLILRKAFIQIKTERSV